MSEENQDIRKTFASYLGIVFRAIGYWKWGVLLCVVVTAGGTVYAASLKKIWRSHTRIQVVSTRVADGFEAPESEQIQENLKRQIQSYISADRYLQDIVDEFGLYRDVKAERGWTDAEVLMFMRSKIETAVFEGDQFSFTYYDWDPRKAQAVAQKLAENFMNLEKGTDYSVYRTKLDRIETQIKELRDQQNLLLVQESQFRRSNAELIDQLEKRQSGFIGVEPGGSGDESMVGDETNPRADDSPGLRHLRKRLRDLADDEARLRAKANQGRAEPPVCQQRAQAAEKMGEVRGWFDRIKQQYTPEHPDYTRTRNQYQQAESRYRELDAMCREQQRTAHEPPEELLQVQREVKQVQDQVLKMAAAERRKRAMTPQGGPDAGASPEKASPSDPGIPTAAQLRSTEDVSAELKRMKTRMEPISRHIEELESQRLKIRFQTEQRQDGGARQYHIIDQARVPVKPSGPNRTKIAMISAFGGFALGCGLMLMLGFLDSRVYRPSDLGRLEHIPLLATIPDFEHEVREIAAQLTSSSSEEEHPNGAAG
jgi:capsular polysaccharide biosynthesis protein